MFVAVVPIGECVFVIFPDNDFRRLYITRSTILGWSGHGYPKLCW